MAIAVTVTQESLAGSYAALATHASLHTADPGTTGANEVTGGSPAYARVAITWTAGASDGVYTTNTLTFNLPASTAVTHVGLWSAITGGSFRDKAVCAISSGSQRTVSVNATFTQV
jgi:hypothetical protein